jgi:elongation of very long chain fatty acids protein 6
MIYSWYTYAYFFAPGRWFAAVNSLVHSFMYTYYCLRALRIRVPKKVTMSITFIQLSQMIFGIYVNWSAYQVYKRGDTCHISDDNIKYSILMYASYFMLFAHFFYNAYMAPKKQVSERKDSGSDSGHISSQGDASPKKFM